MRAAFWLEKCRPNKYWSDNPEEEEGRERHGPKVHCWGVISARGVLRLEVFDENLNSEGYLKILKRRLPDMEGMYPEGWMWQQDKSGPHRGNIVKEFLLQEYA